MFEVCVRSSQVWDYDTIPQWRFWRYDTIVNIFEISDVSAGVGRDEVESYTGLSMSETSQPGLAPTPCQKKRKWLCVTTVTSCSRCTDGRQSQLHRRAFTWVEPLWEYNHSVYQTSTTQGPNTCRTKCRSIWFGKTEIRHFPKRHVAPVFFFHFVHRPPRVSVLGTPNRDNNRSQLNI